MNPNVYQHLLMIFYAHKLRVDFLEGEKVMQCPCPIFTITYQLEECNDIGSWCTFWSDDRSIRLPSALPKLPSTSTTPRTPTQPHRVNPMPMFSG